MTARPQCAIDPRPDAQIASARRDWQDYTDYIGPRECSPHNPLKLHAISASDYADYADYRVLPNVRVRARTGYPCSPRSPCSPVLPSLVISSTYRGKVGLHVSDVGVVHVVLFLVYVPMVARVSTAAARSAGRAVIGQLGRVAACTACRPQRHLLRLCIALQLATAYRLTRGICTYFYPGHGGWSPIGRRFGHSVTRQECSDINALLAMHHAAHHCCGAGPAAHGIYSDRAGSASIPPGAALPAGTLDMRLYSQRRQKSWRILWQKRDRGRGCVTLPTGATIGAPGAGSGNRPVPRGTPRYRPIGRLGAAKPLISSRLAPLCNAIRISAVRIAGFCDSGPKNGKSCSFQTDIARIRSPEGL